MVEVPVQLKSIQGRHGDRASWIAVFSYHKGTTNTTLILEDPNMSRPLRVSRTRRDFIKKSGAIALAVGWPGRARAEEEKGLRFSGMVTAGDWAVSDHSAHRFKQEPGEAVKYIIDRMAEAGFSRVYWRTTDGCGQTLYPSKITNVAQQFVVDAKRFPEQFHILESFINSGRAFDFSKFNSVTVARACRGPWGGGADQRQGAGASRVADLEPGFPALGMPLLLGHSGGSPASGGSGG